MRVTCADRRAYFFSIGGAVFSAGAGDGCSGWAACASSCGEDALIACSDSTATATPATTSVEAITTSARNLVRSAAISFTPHRVSEVNDPATAWFLGAACVEPPQSVVLISQVAWRTPG